MCKTYEIKSGIVSCKTYLYKEVSDSDKKLTATENDLVLKLSDDDIAINTIVVENGNKYVDVKVVNNILMFTYAEMTLLVKNLDGRVSVFSNGQLNNETYITGNSDVKTRVNIITAYDECKNTLTIIFKGLIKESLFNIFLQNYNAVLHDDILCIINTDAMPYNLNHNQRVSDYNISTNSHIPPRPRFNTRGPFMFDIHSNHYQIPEHLETLERCIRCDDNPCAGDLNISRENNDTQFDKNDSRICQRDRW